MAKKCYNRTTMLVYRYQNSGLNAVGVIMADAISSQALSDLIGSIYDCALDPSRWERTLADVMHALEARLLFQPILDRRASLHPNTEPCYKIPTESEDVP
jgi:hypothetical protein